MPKQKHGVKWVKFSAPQFGCSVRFVMLMGIRGEPTTLPHTELRRSLKHYLNYGLKPRSFGGDIMDGSFYERISFGPTQPVKRNYISDIFLVHRLGDQAAVSL